MTRGQQEEDIKGSEQAPAAGISVPALLPTGTSYWQGNTMLLQAQICIRYYASDTQGHNADLQTQQLQH